MKPKKPAKGRVHRRDFVGRFLAGETVHAIWDDLGDVDRDEIENAILRVILKAVLKRKRGERVEER